MNDKIYKALQKKLAAHTELLNEISAVPDNSMRMKIERSLFFYSKAEADLACEMLYASIKKEINNGKNS